MLFGVYYDALEGIWCWIPLRRGFCAVLMQYSIFLEITVSDDLALFQFLIFMFNYISCLWFLINFGMSYCGLSNVVLNECRD